MSVNQGSDGQNLRALLFLLGFPLILHGSKRCVRRARKGEVGDGEE
jgi:hypothetical protein